MADIFEQIQLVNRKSKREVRLAMGSSDNGSGSGALDLVLFKNGELVVQSTDVNDGLGGLDSTSLWKLRNEARSTASSVLD